MNRRVAFFILLLNFGGPSAFAGEHPWLEIQSPHFRVLTDGSAGDARSLARGFEQMRYVLADRYPGFRLDSGAPLVVFAARNEQTAKSLEPRIWTEKGAKPAGVFHHGWDRQYVMVNMESWDREPDVVVYHEYTHSVLNLNVHWLPLWLNEGLASFYGYTRFQGHQIYVGAPPKSYGRMPHRSLIPIETLISVDQSSPYYHKEDKVYMFYAESWSLVHFLMFGPGMERGKRLNQFVSLLQQGIEQKTAFVQAFGDFKAMDKALHDYLANFAFSTGVLTDAPHFDEKDFASRRMSLAETEAELGLFHLWTHDPSGARTLVQEAVKEDPKFGLAHEGMGFLNFLDGKDTEAENEFSEAWTLDPTLSFSLFAKTMMSPVATSDTPADENLLHDALIRVLRLNSQFAPAYVQLARLSLRRGDFKTAYGLSRKAEELEPTRAGYHLLSGHILVGMGKFADAGVFAKFVATRWPGADHNEAVELWNSIAAEKRPAGDAPSMTSKRGTETAQGRLRSVTCSGDNQGQEIVLDLEGRAVRFHFERDFSSGFSDTIWFGADHFTLCHHLEGLRTMLHYRKSSDANYAGDVSEIEIRDDPAWPSKDADAAIRP